MIIPYLLFSNKFVALGVMLGTVVTIIFVFNLYTSIAKKQSLWKNFGIMVIIALGVSVVSFLIGLLINQVS
jgi:VIT1/CCC1 family predicted Fe2+/Mn2+ transporter